MFRLPPAVPRRAGVRLAPLVTLLALGATACGGDPPRPPAPTYTLAVRAGDEQSAQAGNRAAIPLQVTVTSTAAELVPGVAVRFRVLPGSGAEVDDSVAVSGPDGVAVMGLRMGSSFPDTAQVMAFVRGQEERGVLFSVVATAAAVLTGVTPSAVAPGDTVEVSGRNFNTEIAGNTVYVGAARARILSLSGDSLLRVVVPPCVGNDATVRLEIGSTVATFSGTSLRAGQFTFANAPLEGVVLSGTELGDCLRLPGDGARYLLVPQLASQGDSVSSASYVVSANAAPATAVVEGAAAPAPEVPAQVAFDMRMRRLEQELAPRTADDAAEIRAAGPARLEALEIGSRRTFSVLSSLTGTATFKQNTAELKYIGAHTLLYYDTLAPGGLAGGFSDAQLHEFGKLFDETLYDVGTRNFGSESDIDGNGRVVVLMSSVVNSLSRRSCSQGSVIGFFYPHDFTSDRGSNRGEILYTLVPDPTGKFDCAHSLADVQSLTPTTMLHEFQHMISHNQHVLARRGPAEDVWLNEGLSILAEELGSRHYEDMCPPPACRSTGPSQMFPDSSRDFIINTLTHAYLYLRSPASTSVTTFRDFGTLAERGGAWLFLRWLVDQKGEQIVPRLVQTRRTSIANVEFAAGESFPSLFGDFGIAVYADSVPGVPREAVPERYRFRTRNLRALFERLHLVGEVPTAFPITIPASKQLGVPGSVNGIIAQGSMEFLMLQTPTGSPPTTLRFARQGGGAFAADLRAQIGILRLPASP